MDMHGFEKTPDGLFMNRRSVLKCVATWAGTGVVWALVGGVPRAFAANAAGAMVAAQVGSSAFIKTFNNERPHEALNMKTPAEVYQPATRPYNGIEDPNCPFHDKTVVVTNYGRLCIYRKKVNPSVSLAGQAVGIKGVDEGIWLVTFMQYDLGYIDLKEKALQPLDNPFGARV